MAKRILEPNTTLYPVAVVLVTTGGAKPNVLTCNRVASVSAEPPRLAISVRPNRYSHALIRASREFVVNLPAPDQQTLADYLGVVTGREEDKIATAQLKLAPALKIKTPLLADCPVNIECIVEREIELDSHTLFIGLVQAVHTDETLLDANGDVDVARAGGIVYACGAVRERPTGKFNPDDLRRRVKGE
ncbi:MAG: flavin reductase family protein [Chloroflexi bacterium]|nr:flavin reductase family protein [Chloroflexota bacterium]